MSSLRRCWILALFVLGLTFGIDPNDLGLKLPLVGRLGLSGAVTATALPPPNSR